MKNAFSSHFEKCLYRSILTVPAGFAVKICNDVIVKTLGMRCHFLNDVKCNLGSIC